MDVHSRLRCQVTTLGKLFTLMSFCYNLVPVAGVMPDGWEANRLASLWPRVADFSGLFTDRLQGHEHGTYFYRRRPGDANPCAKDGFQVLRSAQAATLYVQFVIQCQRLRSRLLLSRWYCRGWTTEMPPWPVFLATCSGVFSQ